MIKRIEKPWGYELIICTNKNYTGKIIHINKGFRLSKQYHKKKQETLYLLKGDAKIQVDNTTRDICQPLKIEDGAVIEIPPKTIHRIKAIKDCTFIEFSTSQLTDVVRLEDDFGRIKRD